MILPIAGHEPDVSRAGFVAANAAVCGNVVLGEDSTVWFSAAIRAEAEYVKVGARSNVQDQAMLHTQPGSPVIIGEGVSIGHGAIVHGAQIDDDVLIGMHATVLNRAHVGKGSLIAAGALVTEDTVVPPYSLVMGVPGKVVRQVSAEQLECTRWGAASYVELGAVYRAAGAEG